MQAVRNNHATGRLVLAIGLACAMQAIDASGQTPADEKSRGLYTTKCALCHGVDGTPKPIAKNAPAFTDPAWAPSKEAVVTVLMNGKGDKMKSFKGKLTPEEMGGLAEYVLRMKGNAALAAGASGTTPDSHSQTR